MTEHENEPIPGLPGMLPPGERILWQGSPDWRMLARSAFHTRVVAGYFAVLAAVALASALIGQAAGGSGLVGVVATATVGILGVGLLHLLAFWSARTTIYTLTNRRIVLRIGMALPKCVNLPLGLIGAVDLAARPDGSGDVPLAVAGPQRLGYAALWPHARPWKVAQPQPMLRAIPRAADVASLIARSCIAADPAGRIVPAEIAEAPRSVRGQQVAA